MNDLHTFVCNLGQQVCFTANRIQWMHVCWREKLNVLKIRFTIVVCSDLIRLFVRYVCEVLIGIRWAEAHCATGLIAYHGVDGCLQTQTFIAGLCVYYYSHFLRVFPIGVGLSVSKAIDYILLLPL